MSVKSEDPASLQSCCLRDSESTRSQPVEQVQSLARTERPALLETLKSLVSIESGSRDIEGLDRIAQLIAGRLKELGGQVELVEPFDIYKMEDTPEQIGKMVRATFTGTGTKKILLLAHMDTVYPRGMLAKQPFTHQGRPRLWRRHRRRQAGHRGHHAHHRHAQGDELPRLRHAHRADQRRRGDQLARVAQPDHPAWRRARRGVLGRRLARESDKLALATAGIASVTLTVQGRAVARRQRAREGRQRALRAGAPDPADARPVRSRDRPQDELDARARRPRPQHDPAQRPGDGRRARAAGRRL